MSFHRRCGVRDAGNYSLRAILGVAKGRQVKVILPDGKFRHSRVPTCKWTFVSARVGKVI